MRTRSRGRARACGRMEAMVGRTKLIRKTGSPLIGGFTRPKSKAWRWVVVAAVALAAVAGVVWYFFLR
jgi:hypothetical protein